MSQTIGEIVVQMAANTGAFVEVAHAAQRANQAVANSFVQATLGLRRVIWRWRLAEYHEIGMVRPNGRPRRSGHRHRGTVGWERRHG